MNMQFYKEHIEDELEGAKQYIRWAIELKGSKPSWSKSFVEMSAAELKHADALYKMHQEHFESIASAYKEIPGYISEIEDCIEDMYDRCVSEVKHMHDLYGK